MKKNKKKKKRRMMMMMMQKENQMITTSDSCMICAVKACRIELFYKIDDDNFLSFSTNDNNNLSNKMIQSDDYFSLKIPSVLFNILSFLLYRFAAHEERASVCERSHLDRHKESLDLHEEVLIYEGRTTHINMTK